ncbi:GSCFA domain-containing protein [Ulvibacter antarcticus]|uniref:GSCFA family protein n=1 Tax=Ulvibacter antarcticus TaxID=442714 RepID=A0A3L9YRW8_9FLAO|nr:GSCFA domain-containing protein [Ulvibacter antarcticus]RMA57252.1 GSCFA family protein [Ulvibacter antarcticus]
MKLQTQIPLSPERNQIDYSSKVLLMGSCFVEHIGDKMEFFKFQNLQNPFGIIFHPFAIEKLVTRAINEELFLEEDIFFYNERWHCFEVHSMLSASEKDEFLNRLNVQLKQLGEYLISASHIILTYGTSWVYRHIESDTIVANCHKIPQKKFLKELLSVEEVAASIDNTSALIKALNPNITFIHTVSPVRHLKDGFVENTRSKAHLIAGLHEQIDRRKQLHYFPSYEIVLDELRDYRFYKEDMLHPSKTAISIVWEKFNSVWVASETQSLQKKIQGIQAGLQHRPFNEDSDAHKEFKSDLQKDIAEIKTLFPHIEFD